MKISRRNFLKVAAAAGAAGVLAACGSSSSSTAAASGSADAAAASGDKVTINITWWGGQSRHDYTQKMLDKYTELHPNITFQTRPSGWDGYFEKLATDTATGGMPDIVQMSTMYISTYSGNDSLADLSEFVSDGTIDATTIDEALLSSGKLNGKLVGIPLATSLVSFIYNPSVLDAASITAPESDWTWDDFASIAKQVKEATGKYGLGGSPVADTTLFSYWVRGYGKSLYADDHKSLGFDDPSIISDYFQYWSDLMSSGAVPNPDEYEQIATLGNESNPVITNDAAFCQSWNNFTIIGANAGNETLQLITPPLNPTNNKALWNNPSMFFSIAETSPVKKECAEFINWFLNSDEANDIMLGERGTPSSSTARQHLVDSGKLSAQQVDMFNYVDDAAAYCGATPTPDPAGSSEINTVFKDIGYQVFYNQTSAEDAAKDLMEQVNQILASNN